jgi:hypothetical protein
MAEKDIAQEMQRLALARLSFGFDSMHISALENALSYDEQMDDKKITRSDLRKMLYSDAELSAAFQTRQDAILCTPHHFQHDDSPAAVHLSDLLSKHMRSIINGWYESIKYGYSVQCINWWMEDSLDENGNFIPIKNDGFYTFKNIASKPIEHFVPAQDGGLCLQTDDQHIKGTLDCCHTYVLSVNDFSEKNPYGHSLLADLHRDWYDRTSCIGFQMFALDRFTNPVIVGKVENTPDFNKQMERQGIVNYFTIGEKDSVDLLINGMDDRCSEIAQEKVDTYNRVVLGSTLTTIAGGGGSLAQSRTHEQVREDKAKSDINGVIEVVNKIISAFWSLNKLSTDKPVFIMGPEQQIDFERVKLDENMVNVHGVKFSEDYLTRTYGYAEDDFTIAAENQPPEVTQALSAIHGQGIQRTLSLTDELNKAIEYNQDDLRFKTLSSAA